MASPFVQVPTISINNRENRNEEEIINFFDDFFLCEKLLGVSMTHMMSQRNT